MKRARNLGEALTLIMKERGWSQTRLAGELGEVSQKWVSDIVLGKRDCRLNKVARLMDKLGWEVTIHPKGEESDPVKRREFLAAAASSTFIPSPTTTPYHDPSVVRHLTQRVSYDRHQVGGNSLAASLVRQAQKVRSASASGSRELQSAASEFMWQGSCLLQQAGRPDLTAQFANSALRLAEQAQDPSGQAWACSMLSLVSIYPEGKVRSRSVDTANGAPRVRTSPERAVMYARHGLDVPGIDDYSRAFLTSILACGLANVPGQERQARIRVEQSLNIDTLRSFDRGDVVGIAGAALRDSGESREALKMFDEAAVLSSPGSLWRYASGLSAQTLLVLDMRDWERAVSLMNNLSRVVPMFDSAALDTYVAQILRASEPWSTAREMREARERLKSVRLTNAS